MGVLLGEDDVNRGAGHRRIYGGDRALGRMTCEAFENSKPRLSSLQLQAKLAWPEAEDPEFSHSEWSKDGGKSIISKRKRNG